MKTSRFFLATALSSCSLLLSAPLLAVEGGGTSTSERTDLIKKDQKIRETPVEEREHDAYSQVGIRVGSFMLLPDIRVEESYNDNLYASGSTILSDWVTQLKPGFKLQSDWNRHMLKLEVAADLYRHMDYSSENHDDVDSKLSGRLDISQGSWLDLKTFWKESTEQRGTPDDAKGLEPTPRQELGAEAELVYEPGLVKLKLTLATTQLNIDDVTTSTGSIINNDDRDRRDDSLTLRVWREVNPGDNKDYVFVQGGLNQHAYDQFYDDNGLHRDSSGWRLEAGYGLRLSGKLVGELFGGVFGQNYEDSANEDVTSWSVGAKAVWSITTLTTLTGTLERDVEETTLVNAAGNLQSRLFMQLDHELLRNLRIGAKTTYTLSDYQGIDRQDDNLRTGLYANYLFTRALYAGLQLQHVDNDSTLDASDYRQNLVTMHVGYRF